MRPMWHAFPKDPELGRTAWWSKAVAEATAAKAAAAEKARLALVTLILALALARNLTVT